VWKTRRRRLLLLIKEKDGEFEAPSGEEKGGRISVVRLLGEEGEGGSVTVDCREKKNCL